MTGGGCEYLVLKRQRKFGMMHEQTNQRFPRDRTFDGVIKYGRRFRTQWIRVARTAAINDAPIRKAGDQAMSKGRVHGAGTPDKIRIAACRERVYKYV